MHFVNPLSPPKPIQVVSQFLSDQSQIGVVKSALTLANEMASSPTRFTKLMWGELRGPDPNGIISGTVDWYQQSAPTSLNPPNLRYQLRFVWGNGQGSQSVLTCDGTCGIKFAFPCSSLNVWISVYDGVSSDDILVRGSLSIGVCDTVTKLTLTQYSGEIAALGTVTFPIPRFAKSVAVYHLDTASTFVVTANPIVLGAAYAVACVPPKPYAVLDIANTVGGITITNTGPNPDTYTLVWGIDS